MSAELELELIRIRAMPHGSAQVVAAEAVYSRIEAEGPQSLLPEAHAMLVEAYVWGREADKAFVPFTRWLRLYDERGDLFTPTDRARLFWAFRWMVSRAWGFPQVSYEQIESTLADMERRFAEAGLAMDAVRLDQFHWSWARGAEDTEERFWAWVHTPREAEDTCLACDAAGEAAYLLETGRPEQAARRALEGLALNISCLTEPANMLAVLAEAQLVSGDSKQAARALRSSLARMPSDYDGMRGTRGHHIRTLARGGQLERAVRHMEKESRLFVDSDVPEYHMWWLVDMAGASRLVAQGMPELPVNLAEVPVRTAAELAQWTRAEALKLAKIFDERNRATRHVDELEQVLSWELAPEPLDLTVVTLGSDGVPQAPDLTLSEEEREDRPDPGLSGAELERQGDRLAKARRLTPAAKFYLEAAHKYREAGQVLEAGLAEASAAHCAHQREDAAGADATFRHAVGLLRAGGASPAVLAQVVGAWVPAAVEVGRPEDALELLGQVRAQIATGLEKDGLAAADERAARTALAELDDVHARALASQGRYDEAVGLALDAAERFTGLGDPRSAGHAFWLAGKALLHEGREDEAATQLEAAIKSYRAPRDRRLREQVRAQLVELLQRLGREEDVERIVAQS